MKIKDIQLDPFHIDLKETFRISFSEETGSDNVLVRIITDQGIYGLGEAAPYEPVTGETTASTLEAIKRYRNPLIGMDPTCIELIHYRMDELDSKATSAQAAVDMALYDILGKKLEKPVYKLLGGFRSRAVTDVTIGIDTPEKMAAHAERYVAQGFRILKIKVGIDLEHDIAALRLIRQTVGKDILFRVDANQGYSEDHAWKAVQAFAELGVAAIEQAFPAGDLEAQARLRVKSPIDVMLDESLHSPADAARACKLDATDFFNIKLMKCGGLYRGLQINAIAQANGVGCMVGCMLESRLAITAGLSLVAAQANITEADCDSFLLCAEPPIGLKGGFTLENGIFQLLDQPGLGVEL